MPTARARGREGRAAQRPGRTTAGRLRSRAAGLDDPRRGELRRRDAHGVAGLRDLDGADRDVDRADLRVALRERVEGAGRRRPGVHVHLERDVHALRADDGVPEVLEAHRFVRVAHPDDERDREPDDRDEHDPDDGQAPTALRGLGSVPARRGRRGVLGLGCGAVVSFVMVRSRGRCRRAPVAGPAGAGGDRRFVRCGRGGGSCPRPIFAEPRPSSCTHGVPCRVPGRARRRTTHPGGPVAEPAAGSTTHREQPETLRLLAVHAHPDDESSKGAATTARYAAEGVDVLVATCTGESAATSSTRASARGRRTSRACAPCAASRWPPPRARSASGSSGSGSSTRAARGRPAAPAARGLVRSRAARGGGRAAGRARARVPPARRHDVRPVGRLPAPGPRHVPPRRVRGVPRRGRPGALPPGGRRGALVAAEAVLQPRLR